jgi:Kef-type K+ transport system membrane component KefB
MIGLAMVIGAYAAGLVLSNTRYSRSILEQITPIYQFLVPVFFVTMGMTMNLQLLTGVGLVILVAVVLGLACVGKVAGCGLIARVGGFNRAGSFRVGIGMMPRGEVGLIVAYIGLSSGIIGHDIFTVGVLMSVFTTILTPSLLKRAFQMEPEKGWVGYRRKRNKRKKATS